VTTFAGICGNPGHVDGPFTQNKLNRPELIAVDAQGYIFIYDAGNEMVRMIEPGTGIMHSMIDGACRPDLNQVPPNLPF